MKIMTIGLSPYVLAARGKIHASILKHLYTSDFSVSSMVWGHDITYFVPKEEDGKSKYYYDFEHDGQTHHIPITPFIRDQDESVIVYETMMSLKPDIVITVGDISDFLFMKAVKMFYPNQFNWLAVLMNYCIPVSEHHTEVFEDIDGVLCSSNASYEAVKVLFQKDLIDTQMVGCDCKTYKLKDCDAVRRKKGVEHKFRIMVCDKRLQSDNIPTVMRAASELRSSIPNIELYIHTNMYDNGEYDFEVLRNRFDPDNEFITVPEEYVSLIDGISGDKLADEMNASDLFLSVPMVSASSVSVFEAMACGCWPLMSDCGSNRDLAGMLAKYFNQEFSRSYFTIPCIELMTVGESYLHVCKPDVLKERILAVYKNAKKHAGQKQELAQFTRNISQEMFLNKLTSMAMTVKTSNNVICLETV